MTASGCRWPGCTKDEGRPWCDEHFKLLPGHIRIMIARREDRAEIEALAWIRVTFSGSDRGRWDPGKWERLVRSVRDRDQARERRRAGTAANGQPTPPDGADPRGSLS